MFHSFLGLSLHLLAFCTLDEFSFTAPWSVPEIARKKLPEAAFTSKLSIFMLHRGLFSLAYLSQVLCSILMSKRNFPLKYHPIICKVWLAMYLKSKLKKKCQAWETRIPTLVLFFKNLFLLDSEGKMRPTVCICLCTYTVEPCLDGWLEHSSNHHIPNKTSPCSSNQI